MPEDSGGWSLSAKKADVPSGFDFHFYTAGQIQFGKSIHRTAAGGIDIQEAFVGSKLKLLAALFIHVRRPQHGEDLLIGGQRNGAGNDGAGVANGLYDFLGGLVNQIMVVRLQLDTDTL